METEGRDEAGTLKYGKKRINFSSASSRVRRNPPLEGGKQPALIAARVHKESLALQVCKTLKFEKAPKKTKHKRLGRLDLVAK